MVAAYDVLKSLHVALAIVAVGVDLTYPIILGRAERDRAHLGFAARLVQTLDDRVAGPAYVLLAVTGVGLVQLVGLPWSTPWIAMALSLYVVLAVLGLGVYRPILKGQAAAAEAGDREAYDRAAVRGRLVGAALLALALTIVFVMVSKPALG